MMNQDENRKFTSLLNAIKRMTFSAHQSAKRAHDEAFATDDSLDRHKIAAVSFINQASAYISAAYAIYYSNYDMMARNDIDDVFSTFQEFAEELLDAFSEGHNYQYTGIYYERFEKAFESSTLNYPIED